MILLTNRVHAARARRPSKVIADVRNDLADAAVLAVMDDPGGVLAMPASFRADAATDWNRPLRSSRARSGSSRRRGSASHKSSGKASSKAKATAKNAGKKASSRSTAAKKKTPVKSTSSKRRQH